MDIFVTYYANFRFIFKSSKFKIFIIIDNNKWCAK